MHEEKIEGKIEENEENRGLKDKNDSKEQFTTFYQFSFRALYLFSHYTLAHLEFSCCTLGDSWHTLDLGKEGKGRKERTSFVRF